MYSLFIVASFCSLPVAFSTSYPCGISPNIEAFKQHLANPDARINDGSPSVNGDWPFIVKLEVFFGNASFPCTGTIIHPNWVLTAAHCLVGPATVVHYGDVKGNGQPSVGVKSTVPVEDTSECEVGGSPDMACYRNRDLTLVELSEPLQFDEHVTSICLSSHLTSNAETNVAAAGYGETLKGNYELREDVFAINYDKDCREFVNYTDKMFCAGGKSHVTTSGDSGGPLMTIVDDKWYQLGVTSSIFEMGETRFNVFMAVPEFCPWIQASTRGQVQCE